MLHLCCKNAFLVHFRGVTFCSLPYFPTPKTIRRYFQTCQGFNKVFLAYGSFKNRQEGKIPTDLNALLTTQNSNFVTYKNDCPRVDQKLIFYKQTTGKQSKTASSRVYKKKYSFFKKNDITNIFIWLKKNPTTCHINHYDSSFLSCFVKKKKTTSKHSHRHLGTPFLSETVHLPQIFAYNKSSFPNTTGCIVSKDHRAVADSRYRGGRRSEAGKRFQMRRPQAETFNSGGLPRIK